jgi:putative DNA primase/helicase
MRINFDRVSSHLLARSRELLPAWFPEGKFRGNEFVVGNLRGAAGESLSINWRTGLWSDFSTGEKGGDLIALYAAAHGLSQAEAAAELCPEDDPSPRLNGKPAALGSAVATEPAPAEQLPPPTAAPVDSALPAPIGMVARWLYYLPPDLGPVLVVCRLPGDGGDKSFRQYTWRGGRWMAKGYGDHRPLYHLPELLASPKARVLIVEGEKAADAAQAALDAQDGELWIVITWAAGAKAFRKSDWTPLKGRSSPDAPIVIWPDADVIGREAAADIAAILIGLGCTVAIVPTDGRPEAWDAADADAAEIPAILALAAPIKAAERLSRAKPLPPTDGATISPDGRVISDGSAFVQWQSLGLECNGNGQPFATLGNASIVLNSHPDLAGKIWRDVFRDRIYHSLQGDPKPWTDADALRLTAWMNQKLRLPKVGLETVHHAVQLCAANNPHNSVTEWLESLVWDGVERLSSWLSDFLGVIKTAFTMAVARNWLISMVARAYRPGCQADHMPVLEGSSGAGKSSALAILGGEWYRAAPQAFGSKEFVEVIQGTWLVEIPDMVGFGRREHTQIISAITTRSDSYRASYGRNAEDHPRTVIFAATSETDEYLQDSRGKRRYWPLRCTDIALNGLRASREQLFAEAAHAFRAGATWHEVPAEEARREQAEREQLDMWTERIDYYARQHPYVTVSEIATRVLEIPVGKQTHPDAMRIAKCLRSLGYIGKVERDRHLTVRRYRRPQTEAPVTGVTQNDASS